MRITAAVLGELHAPFQVEEIEIEEPRADEVLVRIAATGICHTDGITRHGDLPFPAPGVLGHEGAGVVAAVGDRVTNVKEGDKVVIGWPWCGECRNCLDGQPRYCVNIGQLVAGGSRPDGSTALRRPDGTPLHSHFFGQSSFATHCDRALVAASSRCPRTRRSSCSARSPAGSAPEQARSSTCSRPPLGSSVVVYGVGTVGLAAVMAARCSGATTIVAIDRHEHRLQLAKELGATDVVNVSAGDPVEAVKEICGGPADFSLECTGVIEVVRQAADSVGMRGTCALIGGAPAQAEFTLDHLTTLWGKRVIGILGGEGRSTTLIGALIDLNRQGRFPYERLVTSFSLEQINDAFEAAESGEVLKPLLTMPA